jgi:hypothetical protein
MGFKALIPEKRGRSGVLGGLPSDGDGIIVLTV